MLHEISVSQYMGVHFFFQMWDIRKGNIQNRTARKLSHVIHFDESECPMTLHKSYSPSALFYVLPSMMQGLKLRRHNKVPISKYIIWDVGKKTHLIFPCISGNRTKTSYGVSWAISPSQNFTPSSGGWLLFSAPGNTWSINSINDDIRKAVLRAEKITRIWEYPVSLSIRCDGVSCWQILLLKHRLL